MKRILSVLLTLALLLGCVPAFAEAEADADLLTAQLVAGMMAKNSDAWQMAILEAGAREITIMDGDLVFSMRGFNINLSAIGQYDGSDANAWLESALTNAAAWDLRIVLPVESDGTLSKKTTSSFQKTIKQAAKSAKEGFDSKSFSAAMADALFCAPTTVKKPTASDVLAVTPEFEAFIQSHDLFSADSAMDWAPVFYGLDNISVSTKGGPHALSLSWSGPSLSLLVSNAYNAAALELASATADARPSGEALETFWQTKLAESAVALAKKKLEKNTAEFDVDDLIDGYLPQGYTTAFTAYKPAENLERLTSAVASLPDAATQAMPKTGVMSSTKNGRTVTIKVPANGSATYVQLRDADTFVIRADGFAAAGNSLNLRVPEGNYTVQFASGVTWYGMEELFGPLGTYTATSDITVAKAKWTLTAGTAGTGYTVYPIEVENFAAVDDRSVTIQASLKPTTPVQSSYPDNPVVEGISPTTGLPASGETYTPIVMVLDNAEDAYPHWGVSQADIICQVPNAGAGATKLLALFADHYPEQAGPVRSGRVTMLPIALSFNSAIAYAGPPAIKDSPNVDLEMLLRDWKFSSTNRNYNLLGGDYAVRRHDLENGGTSHNLSCYISEIHENLINKGTAFEVRPFQFTEEKRTDGEPATNIRILHRGESADSGSNSASRSVFNYDEATGEYTRTNSSGLYIDRTTGETVTFANVLVLRVDTAWENGYVYLKNHMVGSGAAEIFQDGRYIRGAWSRSELTSRLVLVDADGQELQLHPGKTFIIVTNDVADVIYTY